jgi:predicted 3-demethylubiquinone-9 3-methyltransferase (glyoxalase superfamily)
MPKISSFLWFNDQAEQAMNFYQSVFRNSRTVTVTRYGKAGPGPEGSVMTAVLQIDGQEFILLNGGPQFTFTPAISFVVNCETQDEVDYYWTRLSEGGRPDRCGWLQDQFGLSWQVVPSALGKLLQEPDADKRNRVMQTLLQMSKLDIATLERAARG